MGHQPHYPNLQGRREEKNNPDNYRKINDYLKQIGRIMKKNISKWPKENGKRAKEQTGFKPKHSTVDHFLTLRHMVERTWENQGEDLWCCFVDFHKAFHTVQWQKFQERLVGLGVLVE
jgi:hypothetical protein